MSFPVQVFDFPRWASHRSTRRYVRHMSGMLSSRIVRALAAPMLYTFGLSMTVATAHQLAEVGQLPTPWPALQLHTEPFALTSFALALLLVFRTNASYARCGGDLARGGCISHNYEEYNYVRAQLWREQL